MGFIKVIAGLICAQVYAKATTDDSVGCIAELNGYFFDLKPLSLPTDK